MKTFNVNDKNAVESKSYDLLDDYDIVEIVFADGTERTLVERHVPTIYVDMESIKQINECPFCYEKLFENKICENCGIQFVDEPWEEEK